MEKKSESSLRTVRQDGLQEIKEPALCSTSSQGERAHRRGGNTAIAGRKKKGVGASASEYNCRQIRHEEKNRPVNHTVEKWNAASASAGKKGECLYSLTSKAERHAKRSIFAAPS